MRVALYYLFNIGFYMTMWIFRISVLLALIRLRLFVLAMKYAIALYLVCLMILCAQVVWICESQRTAWKQMLMPSCSLGSTAAIVNIVFSVVADSILLFTPLFALYKNRAVPFAHRVRLVIVFGSNILVTIACMVHSAYVLRHPGLQLVLVTLLQLTVALIVVNLPVVSAALHRLYTRHSSNRTSVMSTSNSKGKSWDRRVSTRMSFTLPSNVGHRSQSFESVTTSSTCSHLDSLPDLVPVGEDLLNIDEVMTMVSERCSVCTNPSLAYPSSVVLREGNNRTFEYDPLNM